MVNSPTPAFISRQVVNGRYFFGDLTNRKGGPPAVACAGCEDCAEDYRIERKTFPYHALEFIYNGQWSLRFKGRSLVVGPGSVFVYGPGTSYEIEALSGSPLRKYFVDFTGPGAGEMLTKNGLSGGRVATIVRPEWMRQIFDQLIDCEELREVSAKTMSLHLAELILMRAEADGHLASASDGQAYRSYQRARQVIREQHVSLLSVDEAAKACGLNAAYLSRLFKRFAGEGPLHYLTRLRMQHAADLLLRHSTNVQETAAALGFNDPFHFSRTFKRVHGLSPKAFLLVHGSRLP